MRKSPLFGYVHYLDDQKIKNKVFETKNGNPKLLTQISVAAVAMKKQICGKNVGKKFGIFRHFLRSLEVFLQTQIIKTVTHTHTNKKCFINLKVLFCLHFLNMAVCG